jgi:two-component system, OmpR family, phosphate regulon sensor histidine kinase PhoR
MPVLPLTGFMVARLLAATVIGALLGWLLGHVLGGIAVVMAVILGWQLVNLYLLDFWLRDRGRRDPPDASGMWGDVVSQVVRLHRRKRYHKQRLLEVFRELRRSTAAMPDGVVVVNAQREIVWFNHTAARLLRLKRPDDRGMRITNLIRDPNFVRYMEQGDYADPVVATRGPGDSVHMSFQVVPYSSSQHLLLVRDVSRQVALEAMRKDFVANASHELRSPLTVLTGYLETLLADDGLESSLRAPLDEMQRQTQRMNGIVNDLLDLSRLDALNVEPVGAPIDIAAMCAMLRKDVLARREHPEVRVKIESAARLLGDEPAVQSALSNLVDNAAKFTPASGVVQLRWYLSASGAGCFEVNDNGPGIAEEHLPRLTERFYRIDQGRSRSAGGAGLGLAIVKHVLQIHGAVLEIQSQPGAGSTFTCVFPPRRVLIDGAGVNIASLPTAATTQVS